MGDDPETLPCVISRVDLFDHLVFDALAFRELSTDRPAGFERGAIPWSAINDYAMRYGLVGDDFDRLVRVIRAMDAAWLAYMKEQAEKSSS